MPSDAPDGRRERRGQESDEERHREAEQQPDGEVPPLRVRAHDTEDVTAHHHLGAVHAVILIGEGGGDDELVLSLQRRELGALVIGRPKRRLFAKAAQVALVECCAVAFIVVVGEGGADGLVGAQEDAIGRVEVSAHRAPVLRRGRPWGRAAAVAPRRRRAAPT